LAEFWLIHTGEDGYGNYSDLGIDCGGSLGCRVKHLSTAQSVNSKHLHPEPGGFADRCGYSIWNVMIFEVQKDLSS
jgi:hypothetical protein